MEAVTCFGIIIGLILFLILGYRMGYKDKKWEKENKDRK